LRQPLSDGQAVAEALKRAGKVALRHLRVANSFDETSMVDVMLMQALMRAVPDKAALLIGRC
jgi:hypothetical protein